MVLFSVLSLLAGTLVLCSLDIRLHPPFKYKQQHSKMHAQNISRSLQTCVTHVPSRRANRCRPSAAAQDLQTTKSQAPERSSRNIVLAIDTDAEGKDASQHGQCSCRKLSAQGRWSPSPCALLDQHCWSAVVRGLQLSRMARLCCLTFM